MSDLILLELAKRGEQRAFTEIVNRYKSPMFYMILRKLNNWTDAEDVTQEVFIKAFTNIHKFTPAPTFAAWLFTIARNEVISFIRGKQYRPINFIELVPDVKKDQTTPESKMINEEEVCILKRKIDELNTRGKEALTLYGDGYSYKEIMKILSLPMYAIKSDIFRARTKLNQLL